MKTTIVNTAVPVPPPPYWTITIEGLTEVEVKALMYLLMLGYGNKRIPVGSNPTQVEGLDGAQWMGLYMNLLNALRGRE